MRTVLPLLCFFCHLIDGLEKGRGSRGKRKGVVKMEERVGIGMGGVEWIGGFTKKKDRETYGQVRHLGEVFSTSDFVLVRLSSDSLMKKPRVVRIEDLHKGENEEKMFSARLYLRYGEINAGEKAKLKENEKELFATRQT